MIGNYSIAELGLEHIDSAFELLNKYLGEDFLSHSEIVEYVVSPNRKAIGAFSDNGKLVSVIIGSILTPQELLKYVPSDFENYIANLSQLKSEVEIGLLKSMSTEDSYRGIGIGGMLTEYLTEAMANEGINKIVAFGWEDSAGCHIEGTLLRAGYERIKRIEKFWYNDSIENQYSCPTCGNPCKCSAVLFIKNFA